MQSGSKTGGCSRTSSRRPLQDLSAGVSEAVWHRPRRPTPDGAAHADGLEQVPGPKLANMVQNGKSPVLPAKKLKEIGYTAVIYPLCLFSSALKVCRGLLSYTHLYTNGPSMGLAAGQAADHDSTPAFQLVAAAAADHDLIPSSCSFMLLLGQAMRHTLDVLKRGEDITPLLATFDETKSVVGFDEYYKEEDRYASVHKEG